MSEGWNFSIFGYPARFAEPLFLTSMAWVAVVLWMGIWAALRRRGRIQQLVSLRLMDTLAPQVFSTLPVIKSVLSGLGLCLFVVALGEPQCGGRTELTHRRGIDIVVALDASKSMLAKDISPNRLERAKLELMTLLDELKGDRVGLVVFAGEAFVQCPLTVDYAAAKLFLRAISPHQMPQGGTNIGAALTLSKQLLDRAERGAKAKVIILLSDGEDLSDEISDATKALKAEDIKVYAVGIGSESGEPVPLFNSQGEVTGYQKDASGNTVLTRLDRNALSHLAESTGGEFFYEPRGVAMREVVQRIERLQKSDLESRMTTRFDERFQFYLFPGLALLALGMVLPTTRGRQIP